MLLPLKKERKNEYSTLDIETGKDGELLDIAIYDGEAVKFFSDWQEFLVWLNLAGENNKKYRKFVAHSGGTFDYVHFVEYLLNSNYKNKIEIILSSSDIVLLKLKFDKFTVEFIDSYRTLLTSLEKLSKLFKIKSPKKEIEKSHYEDMQKFKKDFRNEYYDYLKHDVIALYQVCQKFQKVLNIDFFPLTIASLSLYLFRKKFLKTGIWKPNRKVDEYMTKAYAGGRVECFKPGFHENVKVYDINSLYPSVMLENDFPTGGILKVNKYIPAKIGVYHIKFNQKNKNIPPIFWVKDKINGLIFVYQGEGYYFTPEIEEGLRNDVEIEFIDGYIFLKKEKLFSDFVNYYYNLRLKNKNNHVGYICKLILNSLYGKFGQKENKSILCYIPDKNEIKKILNNKKYKIKIYDEEKDLYEITLERELNHRIIYLSAYITSLARVKLYKALNKDVIYCDTDSIHISSSNFTGELSDKIGAWKLEKKGTGVYLGRKEYALNDKITFKGIPNTVNITKQEIEKIANGGQVIKYFLSFPKLKGVLKGYEKACLPSYKIKTLKMSNYFSSYENKS